jgi:protein-S-isoprenylcysteine O-methyltransferase Ste14
VAISGAVVGHGSTLLDRVEAIVRRAAGMLALGAAALAAPGIINSSRSGGPAVGRPELVFAPARLLVLTLGWVGVMAVAWRPLPVQPGPRVRVALLVGGLLAYVAGFAVAIAGRVALGSSYRPSSTIGVALEPGHRLVTHGPYRLVRHPMYLGLALAALGALAVYRTWSAVLFVLQTPVLVRRAQREDVLLAQTYGDTWQRYAGRVPAWLPTGWGRLDSDTQSRPGSTAWPNRPTGHGGRPSTRQARDGAVGRSRSARGPPVRPRRRSFRRASPTASTARRRPACSIRSSPRPAMGPPEVVFTMAGWDRDGLDVAPVQDFGTGVAAVRISGPAPSCLRSGRGERTRLDGTYLIQDRRRDHRGGVAP